MDAGLPVNDACSEEAIKLIANMLGVRREGVTEGALRLQHAGLIQYARGHITVLDRAALEERSCECYAVVKKEYDHLLPVKLASWRDTLGTQIKTKIGRSIHLPLRSPPSVRQRTDGTAVKRLKTFLGGDGSSPERPFGGCGRSADGRLESLPRSAELLLKRKFKMTSSSLGEFP